jgi:hypothetical protein
LAARPIRSGRIRTVDVRVSVADFYPDNPGPKDNNLKVKA